MIRRILGCLLLAAVLAVPATAGEKAKPKLTDEARDGVQTTQDNITKMKIKKVNQPVIGGPPLTPAPPAPPPTPSVN